jgi:twitching motility protein PilJ
MNWFNNLKIRNKLFMVLGVLIFGFIIISSMFYVLQTTNNQAELKQRQTNEFQYLTLKVSEQILQARRAEKDFLLRKDLKYIKRHDGIMKNVYVTLERMKEISISSEEDKILKDIHTLVLAYQSTFKIMVDTAIKLGLNETKGLQGELRNDVHAVEKLLKKEKQIGLTASMLTMRRHEKDFILREADKYIAKMAGEQKKFARNLNATKNISASLKADITQSMKAYHKQFIEFTKGSKNIRKAISAYREKVHALDPQLELLYDTSEKVTALNTAEVEEQRDFASFIFTVTLLMTAAIVLVLLMFVINTITHAFKRFQQTISEVAGGSQDARLGLTTKDELGELSQSFDKILDERAAIIDERAKDLKQAESENDRLNDSIIGLLEATAQLSDKDLTTKVPVAEDVTGPVADALNMMASETSRVLRNIRNISHEVELASNTVNDQGRLVTDVAADERKVVKQTIEKLDETSKTMAQIAQLAQNCNDIADKASNSTLEALSSVTNTAEGMSDIRETISETEKRVKRLGERSQEINGVVQIINNIAERTHVLALNASMQAAAAGDAGRGFAVVADEVQRLAESSRQSTAEIQALVSNIQTETAETMTTMNKTIAQVINGTELAERSGEQMQATQKTTSELASAVEKIAQHSLMQAKKSNTLREQAHDILDSTEKTSKELEQQSQQTEGLLSFSKRLIESVQVFKLIEE